MVGYRDDPASAGRRRAHGELESETLGALWAAGGLLTAAQVRERLPGDLAYTTVPTILSRLHAKGILTRHRAGRGHAYGPIRDEAAHTAERMHTLLEGCSDREAVLARFASGLSAEDERLLHRLLGKRRHDGERP